MRLIALSNLLRVFKTTSKISGMLKLTAVGALLAGTSYAAVLSEGFIFRVKDQTLFRNVGLAESSSTFDSKCENTETSRDKFCVINPEAKGKKILIIGDSHAGHPISLVFGKQQNQHDFLREVGLSDNSRV